MPAGRTPVGRMPGRGCARHWLLTLSARRRSPRVITRAIPSDRGDHPGKHERRQADRQGHTVPGRGDALGPVRRHRGGFRPAARRGQAVHGRRPAPRDAGQRAPHPIRVHDVGIRATRTRHDAGARSRAAAGGARACARSRGRARSRRCVTAGRRERLYASASTCAAAASTSAASRSPPSAEPRSGSTACSGWGISPMTLPASLTIPATCPSEPLTSSR